MWHCYNESSKTDAFYRGYFSIFMLSRAEIQQHLVVSTIQQKNVLLRLHWIENMQEWDFFLYWLHILRYGCKVNKKQISGPVM